MPTKKPPRGMLDMLDRQHALVAQYLVEQTDQERKAMGPPFRSNRLSERDAIQRWVEWHEGGPTVEAAAQQLSKEQLLEAALDAVRLGRRAEREGIVPPPPPLPPSLPPGGAVVGGAPAPPLPAQPMAPPMAPAPMPAMPPAGPASPPMGPPSQPPMGGPEIMGAPV